MKSFLPYIILIVFLSILSAIARWFIIENPNVLHETDFQLFVFGGILFAGYYINYISPKTIIPSFVWSIFAGMALQPLLSFYTHEIEGFKVAMEVMAAFILFYGGLEVPFKNFTKWFFPITWLSFFGLIVSSFSFAGLLVVVLSLLGYYEPGLIPSIVILSAALASTDPTAIIPTLKTMSFKKPFLRDIAITESALTDVSGSIVTRFLLLALISSSIYDRRNLVSYFAPLWQRDAYDRLALQIVTGVLIGFIGYALLKKFYLTRTKDSLLGGRVTPLATPINGIDTTDSQSVVRHLHKATEKNEESASDPALLLSIPLFTFVLGNIIGGAGFLASFVAGLISDASGGLKNVSKFYTSLLDHMIKPFIFISLGALVPIDALITYMPLGILAGLLFMFIIRPFVVFISLFPWLANGTFTFKDLLFLSLVRETGIIAAILIVIAASYEIIQSDFVIALGMWIILCTLVIEPPITPYLAKKIGVAK